MNFLSKIFGKRSTKEKMLASSCYLCGSHAGGRWLDQQTTSALRARFMELVALAQLRQLTEGQSSYDPLSQSNLLHITKSKKWFICISCWPEE